MLNILLFGTRRRIKFIKELKKASKIFGGIKLIGIDTDYLDPFRFHIDKFHIIPRDIDDRLEKIIEIVKNENISTVIPWSDKDILFLMKHRSIFKRQGADILLPPNKYVEIFNDKLLCSKWLVDNKLEHPNTWVTNSIKFPIIAKPRFGQGSLGVKIIETPTQLDSNPLFKDSEHYILQDILLGTEYTIDVMLDESYNPFFIVPRKRVKTRGGEVLIAKVSLEKSIVSFVEDICSKLSFSGIFNVQVMKNNSKISIIEFNPRFGGGSDLTYEAGAKFPKYLLELITKGLIQSPKPVLQNNLVMTRYHDAEYFVDNQSV